MVIRIIVQAVKWNFRIQILSGEIMTIYPKNNNKYPNSNYIPPASKNDNKSCLTWLERLELTKAMMGRGIDYETAELILNDFQKRMDRF